LPVPLQDLLLLRGGKLSCVLPAEPAIARPCPRLAAARHRAEAPGAPAVGGSEAHTTLRSRERGLDLLLHPRRPCGGQLIEQRMQRCRFHPLCHFFFLNCTNAGASRAAAAAIVVPGERPER